MKNYWWNFGKHIMEIIFSKKFQKQAKKIIENKKNLKEKINFCIIDFQKNVRKSSFYRKKLTWNWIWFEELQIWWDIRIIIKIRIEKDKTVFEQIWTHSELFW